MRGGCLCRLLLTMLDTASPMNTSATATHCRGSSGLPLHTTESRMLKNLRVVVMMVLARDPNVLIVWKMKSWPTAPQAQNTRMSTPACPRRERAARCWVRGTWGHAARRGRHRRGALSQLASKSRRRPAGRLAAACVRPAWRRAPPCAPGRRPAAPAPPSSAQTGLARSRAHTRSSSSTSCAAVRCACGACGCRPTEAGAGAAQRAQRGRQQGGDARAPGRRPVGLPRVRGQCVRCGVCGNLPAPPSGSPVPRWCTHPGPG